MKENLLSFCREKNILLGENLLNSLEELGDEGSAKMLLEKLSLSLNKKFITDKIIEENKEIFKRILMEIYISRKIDVSQIIQRFDLNKVEKKIEKKEIPKEDSKVKINTSFLSAGKSLEVKDFVNYFRGRYNSMAKILQERQELENLTSIGKISGDKQKISIIGMITEKSQTKNGNIILEVEDLTGKIKLLISSQKEDLIKESEDIALDSVLGFKGTGAGDIIFVNEIIFPETKLPERKNAPVEEIILFLGDVHYGSKNFMSKSFDKFIDYVSGKIPNTPEVKNIKYIFIVGDLITGVGNYPNQEEDLIVKDLEEQFVGIAELLKKIPSSIKIIISPGNHDCVRIMEPQPFLDETYAWPLYDLENVIITENPAVVNLGSTKDFAGLDILTYHGFSFPYYANTISKLMISKAMNDPIQIMKYLLKNRHLAPAHGSTQYFPSEKDPLFIKKAPDIFVSGHTHKSGMVYQENVLLVSTSTWEGLTTYQEKFGNKPDHCKVPMFNLKTRQVRILDFETEQEGIKIYSEEIK